MYIYNFIHINSEMFSTLSWSPLTTVIALPSLQYPLSDRHYTIEFDIALHNAYIT